MKSLVRDSICLGSSEVGGDGLATVAVWKQNLKGVNLGKVLALAV